MTTRRVDRGHGGVMLLGRREHVTASRPGTTHGAYAHHVSVDGHTAACSGALLADITLTPLDRVGERQRCKRRACRSRWSAEPVTS